jgi:hypothetical protein
MSRLPFQARKIALHRIDIPSPCAASWEKMAGDERVRHCGECNKNVYNLSAMREAEAAALLDSNGDGHLCVRFYRRQDGTVLTSDCGGGQVPAPEPKPWGKLPGVAGLALAALSAAGCAPHPKPPAADNVVIVDINPPSAATFLMGDVAVPPEMTMGKPVQQVTEPPPVMIATMGAPPPPPATVEELPDPEAAPGHTVREQPSTEPAPAMPEPADHER